MKMCCEKAYHQGEWQFCPECGTRVRVKCKRMTGTYNEMEYDWYLIEDAEQSTWFRTYFDNSIDENYRGWIGARLDQTGDRDYWDIVIWADVVKEFRVLCDKMGEVKWIN